MNTQPNKLYCEDCKSHIPKPVGSTQIWSKHIYSQRHLRAKASRMFYELRKKKDPRKKHKAEESLDEPFVPDARYVDLLDAMGPAGVSKSEAVSSKAKPGGVWCVVVDLATDLKYYKNRLSGKTLRNKPVGLNDKDLDVEYIDTIEEKAEAETEPVDLSTVAMPGKWEEVQSSYFFGGEAESEDQGEESNEAREAFSQESEEEEEEDEGQVEEDEAEDSDKELLETTERLKRQAEEEPIELVEKPVYERKMETSSTFSKRPKKPKLQV
jgi:hypothetical protein